MVKGDALLHYLRKSYSSVNCKVRLPSVFISHNGGFPRVAANIYSMGKPLRNSSQLKYQNLYRLHPNSSGQIFNVARQQQSPRKYSFSPEYLIETVPETTSYAASASLPNINSYKSAKYSSEDSSNKGSAERSPLPGLASTSSSQYYQSKIPSASSLNHFIQPGYQLSGALCRNFSTSQLCPKVSPTSTASQDVLDWKVDANKKLLDTKHTLEGAKHKLEDAKVNLMEDIHDTKTRMKEKLGQIIERENIFTIPNLLCLFRIAAAPVLFNMVLQGSYDHALGLFLVAGATDLVDGWIARIFPSQASKLGSFLDPLADKVLVSMLFLSLTINGLIPLALTTIIIYRDVAIIGAASYVRYQSLPAPRTVFRYFDATHATVQLAPTTISKINTAVQLALITAALTQPVLGLPTDELMMGLWVVTGCTTVSSGVSYIFSNDTYKMLGEMKERQQQQQQQEEQQDQKQQRQDPEQQLHQPGSSKVDHRKRD